MIRWRFSATAVSLLALGLSACATSGTGAPGKTSSQPGAKPPEKAEARPLPKGLDGQTASGFPSTYKPFPSHPTAFLGATVLTATGQQIENGVVIASGGKIIAVGGPDTPIPADVVKVDVTGKWITPGVIDAHSHLGVYPSPGVQARSDGNEATDPNTRPGLGRALGLAAGSGLQPRPRRRRHHAANPSRLGQPVRRPLGDAEERAVLDDPGDEVP